MNPENRLFEELSRTINYAKQKITTTLSTEYNNKNLDVSRDDLVKLSKLLELELDKVYRDMAPAFSVIKEEMTKDRKVFSKK